MLREARAEGASDSFIGPPPDALAALDLATDLQLEVEGDNEVATMQHGVQHALLGGLRAVMQAKTLAASAAREHARLVRTRLTRRAVPCGAAVNGPDNEKCYRDASAALEGVSPSALQALFLGLDEDVLSAQSTLHVAQSIVDCAKQRKVKAEKETGSAIGSLLLPGTCLGALRARRDECSHRISQVLMMREVVQSRLQQTGEQNRRGEVVVAQWLHRLKSTGGGGANVELAEAHEAAWVVANGNTGPSRGRRNTHCTTAPATLSAIDSWVYEPCLRNSSAAIILTA